MGGNLGWDVILDGALLSVFLLIAAFLRARVKFLQNFLVPVSLIGGFLAMLMNQSFLGLIDFNPDRLGIYVYHLLAITFVAMGLRRGSGGTGRDALAMGLGGSTGYALQGVVGFGLSFLLMYTIYPDLFPTFGALAPLGFGQGPGQTYAIAHEWEVGYGFTHGGNLALTMAAYGYFWACFIGVPIVNYGIRKGWAALVTDRSKISREIYTGFFAKDSEKPVAGRLTTTSEAVDSVALHIALIGMVYLATYLLLSGVMKIVVLLGAGGFAGVLRGFFFIFAMIMALLFREIIRKAGLSHIVDDGTMSRIAGVSVDYLVMAAIAAISLSVVMEFMIPILVTGTGVGLVTLLIFFWYAKRSFRDYPFERAIALYGMLTGTISTGLVLLRIVDPEYRTPVAQHLLYTGAISIVVCFPLLLIINLPLRGVVTGDHMWYWLTLLLAAIIYIVILVAYRLTGLITFKRPWTKIWLDD
jgi:ESS family glutamate:Na+ symporter